MTEMEKKKNYTQNKMRSSPFESGEREIRTDDQISKDIVSTIDHIQGHGSTFLIIQIRDG